MKNAEYKTYDARPGKTALTARIKRDFGTVAVTVDTVAELRSNRTVTSHYYQLLSRVTGGGRVAYYRQGSNGIHVTRPISSVVEIQEEI